MNDNRLGYDVDGENADQPEKQTGKHSVHWWDIVVRFLRGGARDRAYKQGKHARGKRKPKDWREKKRRARKQAKASRKINRQRGKR